MGKPGATQTDQNQNNSQDDSANQNNGTADDQQNQNNNNADQNEVPEEFQDPKKAWKAIQDLRKENAKHRTSNNGLKSEMDTMKGTLEKLKKAIGGTEDTEVDPEKAVSDLQQKNQLLEVELGIKSLAIENGVSKDQHEYFSFLMTKELESLGENDELSDEKIGEIVKKAKAIGGGSQQGKSSTGVNENNAGKQGNGKSDEITVSQFAKMSLSEKGALYDKDQATYTRLLNEAKEKGLF